MSVTKRLPVETSVDNNINKWKRRRDIPVAILAWIGVVAVILWGAMHIVRALLLVVIAAMLAYALAPAVKLLERHMKRSIAIILTCLIALSLLSLLVYSITVAIVHQSTSLSTSLQSVLSTKNGDQHSPLEQLLNSFGITSQQIAAVRQQILPRVEGLAESLIPLISRTLDFLLDVVVVAVMTIYFMIDGPRTNNWCRHNLPANIHPDFLLDTLQRIVGGYIRGQFLLAVIVGVLVGGGMTLLRVPYGLLLGVLAFILEFIPILGTLVSGAVCTLVALTQGWILAVIVLVYFIVVHVLEGDIIGPRIVGKAIGLHPIVSLAALIAGSELFGIVGALLASPVAGVVQAFLVAVWEEWRSTHPGQFEHVKDASQEEQALPE
ncbi:AI-2E family transporter [Ktedonobacteria bacterium brp13]|nr:AI-2E family transporter [Ktedonobacteria bacterium brp13]